MSIAINTNISSLTAQRDLSQSTNALGDTFERLSSGLRINSAEDDAAGLSISSRMTAKIREKNQAIRNVNDGISVTQIAEAGLQGAIDIIQRMRELAVQSANGTYTLSDRNDMETEVGQLRDELTNIANSTHFNGQNLLDGSFVNKNIAIGHNETVSINIPVSVAGPIVRTNSTRQSSNWEITLTIPHHKFQRFGIYSRGWTFRVNSNLSDLNVGDVLFSDNPFRQDNGEVASDVFVSAEIVGVSADRSRARLKVSEDRSFDVISEDQVAITDISVSTQDIAQNSISVSDEYINFLSAQRSKIGALQNRLESIKSNLTTEMLNTSKARSTIMDADIAQETARLTKNNIIQQASTAILAQANQQPSIVMQLLR